MRPWLRRLVVILFVVSIAGFVLVMAWPGLGAQGANLLRPLIGNQGVAALETVYFTVQDGLKKWQYRLGLTQPETPWEVAPVPTPLPLPSFTPTAPPPTVVQVVVEMTPTAIPSPTLPPTETPIPTPTPWQPDLVSPMGTLAGEGIWSPYLYSPDSLAVAYRTFLQPDPDRPFALAAVVAFDMRQTELHFVLGTEEPGVAGGPRGFGRIPEQHKQAGFLLAAFNGGFQTTHGNFGAMADGILAVPARDGFGTVAMYEDGSIAIGAWGEDIVERDDLVAWRQNGRLVIHRGVVNERVFNNSLADWGGTINGEIVTWRSGLAISQDRQVLYYVAGPSLSMPILAQVMLQIGAANGLLLDINASWVHFTAIEAAADGTLLAVPLFPQGMETLLDRYLRPHRRDFFYLTMGSSD